MTSEAPRCAGPGCEVGLTRVRTAGTPQRFCSARCRGRAYALAHPRALRTAILAPGYVALPASTIVAPEGGNAVLEAGELEGLKARLAVVEHELVTRTPTPRLHVKTPSAPATWKHGANCYWNHECRCVVCVDGSRAASTARSKRRRARSSLPA